MKEVRNLVAAGKNKEALLLLQTQVKEEDKNTAILLLVEFNNYHESLLRNTEPTNPARLNNIMYRVLQLCDKHDSIAKNKTFAEPPILDNLPLDKEGYLLGRKAALEQLHTSLQSKNILTLVNGMGGIGKSTLASFYANFPPYKAAYQHCFWVSVSDLTGEVKEALINAFAEALALYQMPQKEQLAKIQTYLSGLQGQTLLILDNANDKKKVREALDFLRKCKIKVLFTSRANMDNPPSQTLETLLPEDAFTLFTHYFPAATVMPETPQLLKNIDYHTLLTEFMAKSLAHNPVLSLQDLVEITQQQNFTDELLAYTQFTSYHTHTHDNPDVEIQPAKYLLQIFPVQNLSEQEQALLRYFSILPTKWIEMDMLKQLFVEQPLKLENNYKGLFGKMYDYAIKEIKPFESNKNTKPSIFDTILTFLYNKNWLPKRLEPIYKVFYFNRRQEELKLGAILQSLYEKGWLQKSPSNAFACHILVQHILRQQLQPNAKNCELLLKNLYAAIWFNGYTNKLTLAPYLPLVAAVLSWIKEDTESISNIYHCSAAIYETIGNYAQALSYNLENVRISEKVLAADDTNLATSYNNIAITYKYLGDYQKALEYDLKAVSIYKKVLSAEHPDLAISYNNIAGTYEKLGDYQKALKYDLKAVSIKEKILSVEHPSLATSYDNIGVTYSKLDNHQKALEYKLKALSIREKVLSAEHLDLAMSYNNIAITYYYLKDYTTAYSYNQKAVSIRTKVLSKGHPDIQMALNTKAMIEKAMRKK